MIFLYFVRNFSCVQNNHLNVMASTQIPVGKGMPSIKMLTIKLNFIFSLSKLIMGLYKNHLRIATMRSRQLFEYTTRYNRAKKTEAIWLEAAKYIAQAELSLAQLSPNPCNNLKESFDVFLIIQVQL